MTRNLKLISAGVGVAAMLGLMGASTFANFTTSAAQAGNVSGFKAGTLGVHLSGTPFSEVAENNTMTIGQGSIDAPTNMNPGDTWARTLTVTNSGSLGEIYQVAVKTSGYLFQNMQFTGDGVLSNYEPATVSITGTSTASGTPTETLISGAQDQNPQTSADWVYIAPGTTETLTVDVSLPFAANNAYQGTTGNFTVSVNAQQSDNIPTGSLSGSVITLQ